MTAREQSKNYLILPRASYCTKSSNRFEFCVNFANEKIVAINEDEWVIVVYAMKT